MCANLTSCCGSLHSAVCHDSFCVPSHRCLDISCSHNKEAHTKEGLCDHRCDHICCGCMRCQDMRCDSRQVVTVDQVDVFDDAGTALQVSNHRSLIKHCHELTAMNSNMNSNAMLINLRFFHHALQHSATHCSTLQHAADLRERPRHAQYCACTQRPLTSTHCDTLQHAPMQRNAPHHTATQCHRLRYGVATISRLLKIVGLFCRI